MQATDIEPHLTTRRFGRRLHVFEEVDSTNTTARELAEAGAEEGTVVIAESQRRGRGRLGRQWVSPPQRNLYLSLVLRPRLPSEVIPQLTLVVGLAAAETVREWTSNVAIKWPNDLVSGGRKLAGILTEMVADESGVRFVIPGIGVNLNSAPEDFPPAVRGIATSLSMITGAAIDRARFTARLLNRCEARYDQWQRDGFATLAPEWERFSCLTDQPIVVQSDVHGKSERIEGVALGLADDGALRVRGADGRECRVVAGDVTVLGGYDQLREARTD
ncbi:MAG: biotin--[acetyl-CoA-carboxylase] ligase [Deltaproteobacteria bacterium]|nr:biotin--[acetyl-CoA-carboxylase] ligase [Deltaproteobacteria bacterium]MBI3388658.1 biotin--[acetyl-CoA-carboxylase] ligase [Deltaproteobacteria bacterium]